MKWRAVQSQKGVLFCTKRQNRILTHFFINKGTTNPKTSQCN